MFSSAEFVCSVHIIRMMKCEKIDSLRSYNR